MRCRSRLRSCSSRGETPAAAEAVTTAAPSSMTSAPVRAATSHTAPAGWPGLPSYSTMLAPWVSAPSCMFHSAQPVEV